MTQDLFMHGLALLSLTVIGGAAALSVATIVGTLDKNWPRIAAALRGQTGLPLTPPQPFRPRPGPRPVAVAESTTVRGVA